MRLACIAIAPVAIFAAACSDDPSVIPIDRIVHFVPDALDFGRVPTLDSAELPVKLESTGGDKLQIRDWRFDPPLDGFYPRREANGALRGAYLSPSDPMDLVISCEPQSDGRIDTDMYVVFDGGEAKLPLAVEAYRVAPALAELQPATIAFQPPIELGRRVTQAVLLRNAGERAGAVQVVSAQAPFSVTEVGGAPVSAAILEPGESRTFELGFMPMAVGPYTKTIKVALGDTAPAEIEASGEGVEAGTLDCTQDMLTFGEVERGQIADRSLDCTVSGGVYTVSSISIDNTSFSIIAGLPQPDSRITELHLTVRFSASGVSQTGGRPVNGVVSINAAHGAHLQVPVGGEVIPPEPSGTDLKVTMDWSAAGTDFDLHLVREGHLPFETGEDCFWDDLHLDWGVADDPDDDPFLDKDERNGRGPEEINLGRASGGVFEIYVQYFGAADPEPNVPITVDYWLRGARGTTEVHAMGVCGNTWKVGRVDFSNTAPAFVADGSEVASWTGRAISCP